jgi:very-short-patch-repair endonuclease
MRGCSEKTIGIARRLRANQTGAETVLWNRIRNRQIDGHKLVRQVPILGYICDFVCRDRKLVIEVVAGSTMNQRPTQYAIVAWRKKVTEC